jgi:hypothetical protein
MLKYKIVVIHFSVSFFSNFLHLKKVMMKFCTTKMEDSMVKYMFTPNLKRILIHARYMSELLT